MTEPTDSGGKQSVIELINRAAGPDDLSILTLTRSQAEAIIRQVEECGPVASISDLRGICGVGRVTLSRLGFETHTTDYVVWISHVLGLASTRASGVSQSLDTSSAPCGEGHRCTHRAYLPAEARIASDTRPPHSACWLVTSAAALGLRCECTNHDSAVLIFEKRTYALVTRAPYNWRGVGPTPFILDARAIGVWGSRESALAWKRVHDTVYCLETNGIMPEREVIPAPYDALLTTIISRQSVLHWPAAFTSERHRARHELAIREFLAETLRGLGFAVFTSRSSPNDDGGRPLAVVCISSDVIRALAYAWDLAPDLVVVVGWGCMEILHARRFAETYPADIILVDPATNSLRLLSQGRTRELLRFGALKWHVTLRGSPQ